MPCTRPFIRCALSAVILAGCAAAPKSFDSAELAYAAGQKALDGGKCWRAQQVFQNLLSDFPGSHLVDDAQYGLGQSYTCAKDYVTGSFEFERVLNEFPTSDYVDDARYAIAMCYYEQSRGIHHDQTDTDKAIREFRRFAEDYPRSELADDALERVVELRGKLASKMVMIALNYLRWGSPISSIRYCEEALRLYSDTREVPRINFVMAQAKHAKGELEEALEILVRLQGHADQPSSFAEEVAEEIRDVRKDIAARPPAPVPREAEAGADPRARAGAISGN